MQTDFNRSVGAVLTQRQAELAEAITVRHYELKPELLDHYGERGRKKCLQDAGYHLSYLAEAVGASRPSLFADYVNWAKIMLGGRGIPESDLADNLVVVRDTLEKYLPPDEGTLAREYLDVGLEQVDRSPYGRRPRVPQREPLSGLAGDYLNALLRGERSSASRVVFDAVHSRDDVKNVYLNVFQTAQHEIGRLWQENRLTVAQEHYCTAATQMIMSQLYPYIFSSEKVGRTMIAACVAGDLHEIGVRMVADFFEMEGWDTFYLGANSPAFDVVKMIDERDADLLMISATMTFHVRAVRELIAAVRRSHPDGKVKIMVGGYPFNVERELWRDVGADVYSSDALEAVSMAAQLAGGN